MFLWEIYHSEIQSIIGSLQKDVTKCGHLHGTELGKRGTWKERLAILIQKYAVSR